MPFIYMVPTHSVASFFTTHATPDTEIDAMFVKPGTRTIALLAMRVGGKGAGLTALSGIAYRVKKYTTTAAAAGTAITPSPSDPGAQAAKMTAAGASAGVTVGTGGPVFQMGCTSGAAGPGAATAVTPDAGKTLEGAANQSLDLFVSSGSASMKYEAELDVQE